MGSGIQGKGKAFEEYSITTGGKRKSTFSENQSNLELLKYRVQVGVTENNTREMDRDWIMKG